MAGYANTFVLNLLIVVLIASFLLLALAGARLCDSCCQRKGNRRLSAWLKNFSLRFIYEFFFEVCLCTFIHIGLSQEVKSESPLYFWSVSILSMLVIVALVAFVSCLFVYGGPYTSNSFRKGSLRESWWGKRELNSEIVKKHLDALTNEKKEAAHQRASSVNLNELSEDSPLNESAENPQQF